MFQFPANKVLVPTDFSEKADETLAVALQAAQRPDMITVLHVAPVVASYAIADPAVVWETVTDEVRGRRMEEAFRAHHKDPRIAQIQFRVEFGAPGDVIPQVAKDEGFDLIVASSHGRTGVTRLLMGSVAERIVRLAHCPVLVLRH